MHIESVKDGSGKRILVNAKLHDDKEKCSAIISLTDRQLGVIAEDF